jgi:hypothetical protein
MIILWFSSPIFKSYLDGVLYLLSLPKDESSLLFQLASELVSLKVSASEFTLNRLLCRFGENLLIPEHYDYVN